MSIRDLVRNNRTVRKFDTSHHVSLDILRGLIDLARLSACSANRQPLKYVISAEKEKNDKIFPHLRWAGYLTDWPGPMENERPTAYVIVLGDTEITKGITVDQGIAMQSILLGAVELGLNGCIIANIDREKLALDIGIPERYQILHVIALGKGAEKVVLDPVGPDGDIKYWRDKDGVHHVPKRELSDIILDL